MDYNQRPNYSVSSYEIFTVLANNTNLICYSMGDTNANRKHNEYIEVENVIFTYETNYLEFDFSYRTLKSDTSYLQEFYKQFNQAYFDIKLDDNCYRIQNLYFDFDSVNIDDEQRTTYDFTCTMYVNKITACS